MSSSPLVLYGFNSGSIRLLAIASMFIRGKSSYKGDRVKAHIFLCMLAYYVEWHLKQSLAPLLFEDEEIDDSSVDVRVSSSNLV